MTQKLQVEVRAGRIHCGAVQEDYINLSIEDSNSGIQFVEIELSMENFAKMMTGSTVKAQAEMRGLEYVGKVREYEGAKITITDAEYNALTVGAKWSNEKEELQQWLKVNHQREGWLLSSYLGSRDSITRDYKMKTVTFNIGYIRYVEKQEGNS